MNGVLDNVKVGDKLFVSDGMIECLETVERLTQTVVITKHHRFAKNSGKQQGSVYWNTFYARLATDEDIAMARREQIIKSAEILTFRFFPTLSWSRYWK